MGRPKGKKQKTYGVKHDEEIVLAAMKNTKNLHQLMKDRLYELSKPKDENYE